MPFLAFSYVFWPEDSFCSCDILFAHPTKIKQLHMASSHYNHKLIISNEIGMLDFYNYLDLPMKSCMIPKQKHVN